MLRRSYEERIAALEKRTTPGAAKPYEDPVQAWLDIPLDQFPKEEARRYVGAPAQVLHELELGAQRESCDWEFLRRDEGVSLILEDISDTRRLGRLVALQVRLDIADGRVDDAIRGIGTGLALARNVGRSNSYIQTLIAGTTAERMVDAIEELVQTPGCPNLYWALTALPRPFFDLIDATEGEMTGLEREFPLLRTIESDVWSLETARAFGDDLEEKGGYFFGRWPRVGSGLTRPSLEDFRGHAALLALIARSYPEAKQALLAEGVSPQRVEAMPAIQVVALRSYRNYLVQRDELFKWMLLPYRLGHEGLNETQRRFDEHRISGIPFGQFLPPARSMSAGVLRIERRFALLRIIEGLRQYAASHDGALPPNLASLSETPAPDDPATGQPFAYKLEGETAIMTAPHIAGSEWSPLYAVHYEFKLAR